MPRSAANTKSNPPAILLVDDNPDDLLFFQLAWEKAKLVNPVRVAGTRREAMDYLEGRGKFADRVAYPLPALVLLDMRLPDGNGCELVQWIRAHPQLNHVVMVVLSGSARDVDVDQAYRYGANSFLLKTANPSDLEKTVSLIQACWLSQIQGVHPSRLQP